MTSTGPMVHMTTAPEAGFARFVARQRQRGRLIVQPRMGFGSPELMRRGLLAVKEASATTVGTLTLDSYTRLNDHEAARRALREGHDLNGFPLVAHGPAVTRGVLDGVEGSSFPVQVRHGSPLPLAIFEALLASGLDATEGGPVSYCLPYSRVPLRRAIDEWAACCRLLARETEAGRINHLESFGGCMLGQLCPPSLLVALSVLEAMFFRSHGVRSVSLSYAQQINLAQDIEAVRSLRALSSRYLPDIDWHVVIYTYMGVYPETQAGAAKLLLESVRLAVHTRSERLIVKTPVESSRIPTIEENVGALELAFAASVALAGRALPSSDERDPGGDSEIEREAEALIQAVLDLHPDIGRALELGFQRGDLDVPFCLHPDNRNATRACIDDRGLLRWAATGALPLPRGAAPRAARPSPITARELLDMLAYNQRRLDRDGHDISFHEQLGAAPGALSPAHRSMNP
ncbi:methylaspartate mutase [Sorangium sp. So ce1097]|uniref:methylaspartate mutase n=1 Tax=Sorangium sp. So ce1097 TaxID=3133330 RepID=UPI003F62C42E